MTSTWRRWSLWYSTVTVAVIGLLLATAVVRHDRNAWSAAELGTVLVAIGWTAWVGRSPQGAMLTLALVTGGVETIGVIGTYTNLRAGQREEAIAGSHYLSVAAAYGLTAIILVVTATLGRVVRRLPRPSREPSWLSIGLSVGWALLIAAGLFALFGGLTDPQALAVAAAIALTCLAAGGYVGATSRWTSTPRLLATAIPAVLVAIATGDAVAGGLTFHAQLGFIEWVGLALTGIVCFVFVVGAALGAGVASLVPRRSRATVASQDRRPTLG
jgi:hypothetical protein